MKAIEADIEERIATVRNENLIFKSNDLIEAKYRLTVNEQRIVMSLISMIKKEDLELHRYNFTFGQLSKLLKLDKHRGFNSRLRGIIKTLKDRELVLLEGKRETFARWVEAPIIDWGEEVVAFRIAPELKPYLISLKGRFTAFSLDSVQFKREYSFRFYELLKQYEKIKKREITIPQFRDMLQISENEYKLYGDIKRRVIIPAQNEINSKTDISFEFEEVKEARRVVKLVFTIFNRDFKEVEDSLTSNPYNIALNALLENGISKNQASRLCLEYAVKDSGYVLANIQQAKNQVEKLLKEDGLSKPYDETLQGYIVRAIENNYAMFGKPEQTSF